MDIFSVLKQEHEAVKALFEKITDTTERAEKARAELFEKLLRELHSHAVAEQKSLYVRLEKEKDMEHLMAEAEEEHTQVEKMLEELSEMDNSTIEWTAKVTVLKENVEHHVKEEEGEMFKQAKDKLKDGEAEELGEQFMRFKKELVENM